MSVKTLPFLFPLLLFVVVLFTSVEGENVVKGENEKAEACSLDTDCDGTLSIEEVGKSPFFVTTDKDGDGTLGKQEIRNLFERLGVPISNVYSTVSEVDRDSKEGIQVRDIMLHWNERLKHLVTVNDVCEWISHAVRLPQYETVFRENVVVGYDLASMLNENDGMIMLEEIGVGKLLHRKQILRSIAVLLMGIGDFPSKPQLKLSVKRASPACSAVAPAVDLFDFDVTGKDDSCSDSMEKCKFKKVALGDSVLTIHWWQPQPEEDGDLKQEFRVARNIPVHKWRLHFKFRSSEEWTLIDEFSGDHSRTSINTSNFLLPPLGSLYSVTQKQGLGEFRIEAWNAIGKSEYEYATLDFKALEEEKKKCLNKNVDLNTRTPTAVHYRPKFKSLEKEVFSSDLFDSADNNGDGDIDSHELENFISSSLEGLNEEENSIAVARTKLEKPNPDVCLDSMEEGMCIDGLSKETKVKQAVKQVMDRMDGDDDKLILKSDLDDYWHSIAYTMTSDATADWVEHAVNLGPNIANSFRSHSISGLDFPDIIKDDGDRLLRKDLGIESESKRRQIIRGVKLILMGIGQPPPEVKLSVVSDLVEESCGAIRLEWLNDEVSPVVSVHKNMLYRRVVPNTAPTGAIPFIGGRKALTEATDGDWSLVYSGRATEFLDPSLNSNAKYQYKLVAWNLLGPSKPSFTDVGGTPPSKHGCIHPFKTLYWGFMIVYDYLLSPMISFAATVFIPLLAMDRQKIFVKLKNMAKSLNISWLEYIIDKLWALFAFLGIFFRKTYSFLKTTGLIFSRKTEEDIDPRVDEKTHTRARLDSNEFIEANPRKPLSRRNLFSRSASDRLFEEDGSSVHSNDSVNSNGSSLPKRTPAKMWKKLRSHVFNRSRSLSDEESLSDSSNPSIHKANRKPLKSLFSLKPSGSKKPREAKHGKGFGKAVYEPEVTYRGGVRNSKQAKFPEDAGMKSSRPTDMFDPRTCMKCRQHNLKRKHICGKCHGVFCEKDTAYKAHGRFTECKINSQCICRDCFKRL